MKKKMLILFQLLLKIIIILLALSTFFLQQENADYYSNNFFVKWLSLDHFYNSPLNLILFGLLAVLTLASIFIKKMMSKQQIILHLIIVLSFVVIIYDKTMNFRVMMPIVEGQEVEFSKVVGNDHYQQKIYLDKFIIEFHEGSRMPKAFTSKLVIDNVDSVELNVNKPVKIGKYRLYQNAYDKIPVYSLGFEGNIYEITAGDTLILQGNSIWLNLSEDNKKMTFHFNEQEKALSPMGGDFSIEEFQFHLKVDGMKYLSVIEVAAVKGMTLLLVLGLGYLVAMGYVFWRRK